MFYKIVTITLILQVLSLNCIYAEDVQEYTKKISEIFSFSSNSPSIDISNKYGDVDVTISNSNNATVDVTVTVEAKNKDRGQDILDKIEIIMDHSNSALEVETELENMKTKRNETFQIDYKISIPLNSELSLYNKYGNISVGVLNADADIELHYGHGSMSDINGNLDLEMSYVDRFSIGNISGHVEGELSYSEAVFRSCQSFFLEAKYSDIDIESAEAITCDTRYGKYTIGSVGSISYEGKYDDFDIQHADNVIFDGKYSHLKVDILTKKLESNTGYGSVKIGEIKSGFELIKIDSEYTPVTIKVDGGYAIEVDTKYTGVDYPNEIDIRNREKDGNELYLQGKMSGAGSGTITAQMKYGKLNIR